MSATLSSVLASVSLDLTPNTIHQIIPTTGTIGVYALDADNDVIVSNGFVDPNGNPITLSFNDGQQRLNGTLYFSTSSISAPSPTGVQYVYAPQNGVLVDAGNQTVNFSVSSSYGAVTTTGAALQRDLSERSRRLPTAISASTTRITAGSSLIPTAAYITRRRTTTAASHITAAAERASPTTTRQWRRRRFSAAS